MVVRREVIEEIGGLERFGHQMAEDAALARAIRKRGYRIHLLKQPARRVHRHYSFKSWWSRWHRWMSSARHYFPTSFWIMSLVGLSLWWSLFYLAISLLQKGDTHVGLYLIVAVLVTSLISIVVTNAKFVRDKKLWQFLWVVPIQEFVRLPLVMHSGLTNEVAWGERRFSRASNSSN